MRLFAGKKVGLLSIIALSSFVFLTEVQAQLNGQNIAEFQYGKIPDDSTAFTSIYDRLLIDYDFKEFKIGATLEQFWSPYSERNYIALNQVRLQYKTNKWDIKLGNFYETLGRGTLMRTYQVPGAILEDVAYRSRNYFHRDFLGAYIKYQSKSWSLKALAGQPLNNVFPPPEGFSNRRPDSVAVVGGDYQIKTHRIEYNAMYLRNQQVNKWYSMLNISGTLLPWLSYYSELTIDNKDGLFGENDEYGFYFNLNFDFEKLSISTELKDYNNILIGEAVNEPPALIKQHTYRLLNRSTHVPIPINESGWQIEATYYFDDASILTFNHARTLNDLGVDFKYEEYFLEYSRLINNKYDLKLFADYANDAIKAEENRTSFGFDMDVLIKKRRSINIEYEYQIFERSETSVTNMLVSLAFNQGSKFTVAALAEYSTDDAVMLEQNDYKIWLGSNVKYKPNFKNTFLLFAGTRRGGPACTSGVCYEILDFEGVELRFTRRL